MTPLTTLTWRLEKNKKKAYVFDAETEVTKSVTDATDIPSSVVKQSHN